MEATNESGGGDETEGRLERRAMIVLLAASSLFSIVNGCMTQRKVDQRHYEIMGKIEEIRRQRSPR